MANQCSRCLLGTDVPGVRITESGLCSVCTDYDKTWGDWKQVKERKRKELEHILKIVKSKKRLYDVLIPFSGGKDSSYVLFLCRKVYNLNCLAVTFDNGFLTEHARHNIAKTCENLNVDHIYYGLSKPTLGFK
jgi:tRNA(Ile)-lysidine synthase TilS/MesJ